MKRIVYFFSFATIGLFALTFSSCSTEPEPLEYGKDGCQFCKMTLVDPRFGAELVTKKGKIYKFDDSVCFLNFYNSDAEPADNYLHRLIIDYAHPGHLINADIAFYIKSKELKSPMAGNLAAFENKSEMDQFNKKWKGIYLSWGEVVTEFK